MTFQLPVDVGTLLSYDSYVVYTEPGLPSPRIHIRVLASIVRPEERRSTVCNYFTFCFAVASKDEPVVHHVVPLTEDDARQQLAVLDSIETSSSNVGLEEVKAGETL